MYIIEKSFVYQIEKREKSEVKVGIGAERRIELISENETEKAYQCQIFDLEKERYIPDEENSETVKIEGKEYKADKGKIIVPKKPPESEAKIKELEETINALGKQLVKEKMEGIKKDKTISELGKHETKLSMELMRVKNEVNAIKLVLDKDKKGDE